MEGDDFSEGWQPIETAPDDTMRDLIVSDGKYVRVAWLDDEGWTDSVFHGEVLSPQPTHWMPLPGPPINDGIERMAAPADMWRRLFT